MYSSGIKIIFVKFIVNVVISANAVFYPTLIFFFSEKVATGVCA
jgi:hypothetical protein